MAFDTDSNTWLKKLRQLNLFIPVLISVMGAISIIMLYSAAGGTFSPWAQKQLIRFAMGATLMLLVALTPIKFWLRYAYILYGASIVLLLSTRLRKKLSPQPL